MTDIKEVLQDIFNECYVVVPTEPELKQNSESEQELNSDTDQDFSITSGSESEQEIEPKIIPEFSMDIYNEFELSFKKFIDHIPDLMDKHSIFPTVDNIKACLISFVEESSYLPSIIRDQYIQEIEDNKNFCYIINDKEQLDVINYSKELVPIDMKKIEEINRKHEEGTLTETEILDYKIGLTDMHH